MTERIIDIQVHWSDRAEDGTRTFLGVTPFARNDDDSDPPNVFVPKALLNPQIVAAFENNAFPALLAARRAALAALESPEQRKAREAEAAEARKAKAEEERLRAEEEKLTLDVDLEIRRAELRRLDEEIAAKNEALNTK